MYKKTMILTALIFSLFVLLLWSPSFNPVYGANSSTFNVSLTIGNSDPTISAVYTVTDVDPTESGSTTFNITFNVTDTNGIADIDVSSAKANITLSGQFRYSTSCAEVDNDSANEMKINCTLTLLYNNEPGTWNINVTADDSTAGNEAINSTENMTYNTLYAMTLTKTSITFSNSTGVNNANATNNPQIVNNTGNGNFDSINVTALALNNSAGTVINAGNFTINISSNSQGNGTAMVNNTAVTVTGATLNRNTTRNLYIYLDIESGLSSGTYASYSPWTVEAYNS